MTTRRREFLLAIAAGGAALAESCDLHSLKAAELADLDAAREKAAHRRRRVIFNNDGDDIWAAGADTPDKFLAARHTPLLGTHVDSIFYCTTQSFNKFTHGTKVAEQFLSREGSFANNNLVTFLEQGTDGLRMSSEFAHRHGLESIWTLRMNDIHDAWTPQFVPKWKRDDPSRVMSTLEKSKGFRDRRRLWSLVDFEHPDVAPRLLAIIEEVLCNYPVDGVELDFLRAPFYFRTNYEGHAATEKQVGVMTELVRGIRKLVLRESQRQRKSLLLAARLPVTATFCRWIGIDIQAWLEERLIDLMAISGGYVAFDQPVDELIALGHKHNVPAYPCLSQSGLMYRPPRGTSTPQPPAAWFGAAMRFWEAGADGVYTFNLFPGPGGETRRRYAVTILKTLGSKEAIANADRLFAISDAGSYMPAHFWAKDVEEFSHALPVALKQEGRAELPLVVAGPVGESEVAKAELRLDFTGLNEFQVPAVVLNGQSLVPCSKGETIAGIRRFVYQVPIGVVKHGKNTLGIETVGENTKLYGAELAIARTTPATN